MNDFHNTLSVFSIFQPVSQSFSFYVLSKCIDCFILYWLFETMMKILNPHVNTLRMYNFH